PRTMTPDELGAAIPRRRRARADRHTRPEASEVIAQLSDGGVAALGLRSHRLQDDRVDIPPQTSPPVRRMFKSVTEFVTASCGRARQRSRALADRSLERAEAIARPLERPRPRHQLVQQNSQLIDVRGRGDAL